MSAIALDVRSLSPELHRLVHNAISEWKNPVWANVMVGELNSYSTALLESDDSPRIDIKFQETNDSIETESCLRCERPIHDEEKLDCLYEYEDGEPAFYLCPTCESKSVLLNVENLGEDE